MYMRARKKKWFKKITITFRKIRWLRVLKMLGGSLSGIALIGLAIIIAPANFPGVGALRQLAATTLISLTVLPPTPTVTSVTPRNATTGETVDLVLSGTEFARYMEPVAEKLPLYAIEKVLLRYGATEIVSETPRIINEQYLAARISIPSANAGGSYDVVAVAFNAPRVEGVLKSSFQINPPPTISTLGVGGGGGGGFIAIAPAAKTTPTKTIGLVLDNEKTQIITRTLDSNTEGGATMTVVVELPLKTVAPNTQFVITEVPKNAQRLPTLAGVSIMGTVVSIEATNNGNPVTSFPRMFYIEFRMPEFLRMSVAERNSYSAFYLDRARQAWMRMASVANAQGVIAELNHLTEFAVFKTPRSLATIPMRRKDTIGAALPPSFERNLTLGMKGDDVKNLQAVLTNEKVYSGPITGYFGLLTQTGVKNYQKKHNITPQTGFVGPKTIAALNATAAAAATPAPKNPAATQPLKTQQNTNAATTLDKIRSLLLDLLGQLR